MSFTATLSLLLVAGMSSGLWDVASAVEPPSPKAWWTKKMSPDLYTAGRMTESQIKYASEAGFRSLISMFTHETASSQGEERIPTTEEEEDIATRLSGMYYNTILGPDDDYFLYAELETIEKVTSILAKAPKPVLFHCMVSFTATFASLAYLANQTANDPEFQPAVDSDEFYRLAAGHGHLYVLPAARETISIITGEPVEENPPAPDITAPGWANVYWLLKPVIKNWYIAGQIRENYATNMAGLLDTIINARLQASTVPEGEPSQEEVTLLNIEDDTGTYEGGGRQSDERLLETRIDPEKPNEYVDPESDVNYVSRNFLEFGDDIGYNETIERMSIADTGLGYYSTPIGEYLVRRLFWLLWSVDFFIFYFLQASGFPKTIVTCVPDLVS